MEAPSWQFDEARRQYYYWDASESCYVYQSGERIDPHPRDGYGCIEQAVTTNIEEDRPEDITEEGALQDGISAHKKIRETPGEAETLDPRFRRHYPGRDFYKIGKVFKVLWPEPAGNPQSGVTFITGPASYGEPIYAKIRWFVVIREGRDCCTCLPIQTYNRKGVSKKGVIKGEHSIVHTGPYPPSTPEWEDPREEMLQPIPVRPRDPAESKMDAMSRLNYAKPYTVEHNVKSLDFGDVPPEWIPTLRQNFITVLQLEQAGGLPTIPRNAAASGMSPYSPDSTASNYQYSSSPTPNRGYPQYTASGAGTGEGYDHYYSSQDSSAEHAGGYYRGAYGYHHQ
ncbi:hypothetical protein B0J12DRAFT_230432 [Macrophomina phaseolina]|uniref:DUF6590 domain-containing protein n=1 Tax=Macrophomina phaseolina TaxID=35725 RepID=A0ABQ8GPW2_9PEZI|nr:hypothetical protein B0J12DRAFT_230432 [Macrophomina phaseolina]